MGILTALWRGVSDNDFFKSVKDKVYIMMGFGTAGCAPSIEPIKSSLNMITTHNVIEILQILSLLISIAVGITVLYKFFKSLKKK